MTRTADINLIFAGHEFRVRIDYDGGLEILEPKIDMEYEVAFTAMGGDETPAIMLTEEWRVEPMATIAECFWYSDSVRYRRKTALALDFAEHVMHLYETEFPAMHKTVRAVLASAKNHARRGSTLPAWKRENILSLVRATASSAQIEKLWPAFYAVRAFSNALQYDIKDCADGAATAAAYRTTIGHPGGVWDEQRSAAYQVERLWQIRRLIDVTNALDGTKKRKSAAKHWPPMEATP